MTDAGTVNYLAFCSAPGSGAGGVFHKLSTPAEPIYNVQDKHNIIQ
jgi:hypothetical protein